jgi:hypothetical protein
MLDGVILLWFLLTILSVSFVILDIRRTPEATVMKWGFVLLTAYTGPLGAFLYVLGCREPLTGLHERYTAIRWRQVLGSTIHCVAGDGVGILAGAVIVAFLHLTPLVDIALEYLLGFGFGWTIFQALFMRKMSKGSFRRALSNTFIPELLSMNGVMAGMVPVMTLAMANVPGSHDPLGPTFWFIMSMALLAGFIVTYPINWWLVANNLKHGMMTVRPFSTEERRPIEAVGAGHGANHQPMESMDQVRSSDVHLNHDSTLTSTASRGAIALMTILTFVLFGVGLIVSAIFGGL